MDAAVLYFLQKQKNPAYRTEFFYKIRVTLDHVLSSQIAAKGHLWFLISNIFCNPLFLLSVSRFLNRIGNCFTGKSLIRAEDELTPENLNSEVIL